MNRSSISKTKQDDEFDDEEIFEDSTFLANFENSSFKQSARFSDSNANSSFNKSALNVSALCCDEEISGYDKLTGKTWIYPTNYPVRDYQFNIIRAALLKNTLVSLPTGLGKTFIAAVIMYNYYRWYPLGKIIFTAPTRPLVAQQIEACYNIIAIPPDDTIEMTGHMQINTRKTHWQNKRVFFATPQVIYNDIKSGICPADKIRCLVIDEAHRARGNYAYCQIVSTLDDMGHRTYRMLALSATPGSKVDDVVNVVKCLHIAHLELRTETCIDVAPYSHSRKINTVIIQLGPELTQLRQQYVEILDGYARRLKQFNILPQNVGNLSKGRIVMLYKEFQTKDRGQRHAQHNHIMKDFTVLIALYHGLELLVRHGSRVFLNFFDDHPEKSWIQSDDRLTALLERLRDDLGINPLSLDRSILPDGTTPEIPKNLCFGHPKFYKLKEIMMEHFTTAKRKGQDTRAIVFCEYRESVNLVHCLLLQCRPLIVPQMFVGQGVSGKEGAPAVSQRQQARAMAGFRGGASNALVATCVAEEGLDVGSVDLILCFDISTRSPVRLVQRCGRTGRERGGQVFILVTEGREHQTLMDCMRQRDGLNTKILQSKEVESNLYKLNPRMMPRDFTPECRKMHITVEKKSDPKDNKTKKGQKDLRSMLLGRPSTSAAKTSSKDKDNVDLITEAEFNEIYPNGFKDASPFESSREYWAMNADELRGIKTCDDSNNLKLTSWLEWQRTLQKTINIGHSKDSEVLTELLQYCDAKRFELPPSTQNPAFNSQELATQNIVINSPIKTKQTKKKQKAPLAKSPGKKDGDIRALFSTATKSTKSYTKLINDLGIPSNGMPNSLINLLVDLSLNSTNVTNKCIVCQNICECTFFQNLKSEKQTPPTLMALLKTPKFPDIDLIDDINEESINKYRDNAAKSAHEEVDIKINTSTNFNLEFDFDSPIDETPEIKIETEKQDTSCKENFDIGDIEDIFADSSPEEHMEKECDERKNNGANEVSEVKKDTEDDKETLGFFGLDSIDDIFADYDDDDDNIGQASTEKSIPTKTVTEIVAESLKAQTHETHNVSNSFPLSPSILSGRKKPEEFPTSPILCSQAKKFQLSTKKSNQRSSTPLGNVKKQLILEDTTTKHEVIAIPDDKQNSNANIKQKSCADTSNKSMFTITQLVEMINKTADKSTLNNTQAITNTTHQSKTIDIDCERSTSPILLTQAEKKKSVILNNSFKNTSIVAKNSESLIILDSDSDSNDATKIYDLEFETSRVSEPTTSATMQNNNSPVRNKRKYAFEDDTITASPYFNKKQKIEQAGDKQLTLQEKVLAALTSNKLHTNDIDAKKSFQLTISQPDFLIQKENKNPLFNGKNISDDENDGVVNKLDMLQQYRRETKIQSIRNKFDSIFKKSPVKAQAQKRKIVFDDSDDDFVVHDKDLSIDTKQKTDYENSSPTITKHRVRKKTKKRNSLLDFEAELSNSDEDSGDELSDDSVGSIADFICDDVSHHDENIQAVYLKSVKSPMKNGFKIPEIPKKINHADVFSQYVEEDAYEMDSFCVDSHIGLTQVNDVSELELAEIVLEQERKAKKKMRSQPNTTRPDNDSPLIRRKKKNAKRQIHSDSDDSS